jgi:hypothetical protein
MKRLLLSASIIGVVFAGYTPSPPSSTVATKPLDDVAMATGSVSGGVSEQAKSRFPGFQRVALRSHVVGATQDDGTPVASINELFAPALPKAFNRADGTRAASLDDAVGGSTMWVVVLRGAWMHSAPSVSAPLVGHQSPGKELQLIDSSQGWHEVFDPATSTRGWIYAKYYLDPIDRPGQKRVAVHEPQAPVTATPSAAAPVAAAPSRAARRILQQPQFLAPPQGQPERVVHRARSSDEGVASLLDRAFRR